MAAMERHRACSLLLVLLDQVAEVVKVAPGANFDRLEQLVDVTIAAEILVEILLVPQVRIQERTVQQFRRARGGNSNWFR